MIYNLREKYNPRVYCTLMQNLTRSSLFLDIFVVLLILERQILIIRNFYCSGESGKFIVFDNFYEYKTFFLF